MTIIFHGAPPPFLYHALQFLHDASTYFSMNEYFLVMSCMSHDFKYVHGFMLHIYYMCCTYLHNHLLLETIKLHSPICARFYPLVYICSFALSCTLAWILFDGRMGDGTVLRDIDYAYFVTSRLMSLRVMLYWMLHLPHFTCHVCCSHILSHDVHLHTFLS